VALSLQVFYQNSSSTFTVENKKVLRHVSLVGMMKWIVFWCQMLALRLFFAKKSSFSFEKSACVSLSLVLQLPDRVLCRNVVLRVVDELLK
jgi:hypothetical protein